MVASPQLMDPAWVVAASSRPAHPAIARYWFFMRFSPLLFIDLSLSLLVVTGLPITCSRT
jgi:hypothetical protein